MSLAREIAKYDPNLTLVRPDFGPAYVGLRRKRYDRFDFKGASLLYVVEEVEPLIYLTEDWSFRTPAVDRGLLSILQRLQYMDAHQNGQASIDALRGYEEAEKEKEYRRRQGRLDVAERVHYEAKKFVSEQNTALVPKYKGEE